MQSTEVQTENWKPEISVEAKKPVAEMCLTILSWCVVILTLPFSLCVTLRTVREFERLVIYRLGWIKDNKPHGPGYVFFMPCIDNVRKIDMRIITFDVPSQEVLTRDSCTVQVDAVVYYRVSHPIQAIQNVVSYDDATWVLAATTLRAVLGRHVLAEILSEKEMLAHNMQSILKAATLAWGVTVENVEIKDVRLPLQMQRAMAAEAEATREARARIISAEGEMRAAQNLRAASNVIASSPAAIKLRYLQTISTIAAEKKSIILFPVPMNM